MAREISLLRTFVAAEAYGAMIHVCPVCGERLSGVLEILFHGTDREGDLCFFFISDTPPAPKPAFHFASRCLYDRARYVIETSMCCKAAHRSRAELTDHGLFGNVQGGMGGGSRE